MWQTNGVQIDHDAATNDKATSEVGVLGRCVSTKTERDSCAEDSSVEIEPKRVRCWPHSESDEHILKRILWPNKDPNSISWPHAYWQLVNTCVSVSELKITSEIIRSVNLHTDSISKSPNCTDRDLTVRFLETTASKEMDENEARKALQSGLWKLTHACVDVPKLELSHKIGRDGSVKLQRQMVQVFPVSDTFVSVQPRKVNKVVPVIKPAERKEIFALDAVRELYRPRSLNFQCDQCGKGYARKSSLNFHVKDKHMHVTRFRCNHCERCFLSKSQFAVHVARHIKQKRSECRKCLQKFYSISDRNKHLKTCFKGPQFKCKTCLKRFQTRESLRCHVMQKLSRRRFKCGVCDAKFKHYASLHKHFKTCNT